MTASEQPGGGGDRDSGQAAGAAGPGRLGPRQAAEPRRRRYGLLLIILIATFLLSAFYSYGWMIYAKIGLFVVAALLAVRNTSIPRSALRVWASIVIAGSLLVIVVAIESQTNASRGAASLWTGLLLLLMVVLLIHQILRMPEVTIQSIYGALCAYLVIGLMFSSFYAAMYYLHGGQFFAQGAGYHSPGLFQYFSFTTLTTLGYGDFTAKSSAGRALAMIEAMAGQVFLATLVAKLVSAFRPSPTSVPDQATRAPRPDD